MPWALQNTLKGRMVGYKDHRDYGDSSIYTINRSTKNGIQRTNPERLNGLLP